MRMPSQEKTLQRLQNPAETLCERPRAGTARRRLRHSQARRAKRKSIPGRRMHALQRRSTRAAPPPPPLRLSPLLACDPATAPEVLWFIAEHEPELRRWLVANPSADAALLEYVAQAGGPGVNRALTILLDGLPAA